MMNLVQKISNVGNVLKATSYVTCYPATPSLLIVPDKKFALDSGKYYLNASSTYSALPSETYFLQAVSGVTVKSQYRYVHTDVRLPGNEKIRRTSTVDPTRPSKETVYDRRAFTYFFTGSSLLFTAMAAKTAIVKPIMYFGWNQDVQALGNAEIDISSIPEGKSITFKWQGKPLFIKHRTDTEIKAVRDVPVETMRDPEPDEKRVKNPKWLICLGICTHLGCVPLHNKGENVGGFYCPCHGSHYDASGRVTNGPAPNNLEIPNYYFKDSSTLVVG